MDISLNGTGKIFFYFILLKAILHPWEMRTLKTEAHLRFFLMEKISGVTRTALRNILGQIFIQEGFYSLKNTYFMFFENKGFEVLLPSLTYKPIYFFYARPQQERAELQILATYTELLFKQQKNYNTED